MYVKKSKNKISKPFRSGSVHRLKIVVFCFLFALNATLPSIVVAASYYVDPINGNDSNPGTSPAPWKTISKAESSAVNGSTVYLRSGNYGDVVLNTNHGRASWDEAVTYRAESGKTPVFTNLSIQGYYDYYTEFNRINVISVSLAAQNVVDIKASHVKVIDCNVTGNWPYSGNGVGITADGAMFDVLIQGCDIQKVLNGIYVCRNFGADIVLRNNNIHWIRTSGITLDNQYENNTNTIIEGNHIHDTRRMYAAHGSGIECRASHLLIKDNIIHDYAGSGGIRFYGSPITSHQDITIENNLFYDGQGTTGVYLGSINKDITVRNNTFICKVTFLPYSTATGVSIYNNIFAEGVEVADNVGFVENNNICRFFKLGSTYLQNPVGANTIIIGNFNGYYPGYDKDYFQASGRTFIGGDLFDKYAFSGQVFAHNFTITAVDINLDKFGVQALGEFYSDWSEWFRPGSQFTVSGSPGGQNDGTWTVGVGNSYDGTISWIPVTGDITGSVGGTISYLCSEYSTIYATKQNLNDAFKLAKSSPAIGFADPAHATTTDLLGNLRDAQPDAGCYEYVARIIDKTPPTTPQNLKAQALSESRIDLTWDASDDPESGISGYNIYRDNTLINTSTTLSFSDTSLNSNTTYTYQVSAVNGQGLESGRSNTAQTTTFSDTTPPTILSVTVQSPVHILFSEPLDEASATDISNYSINPGIIIHSATLEGDLRTVVLITSDHIENVEYTLTVNGVKDLAGNPMVGATYTYQYSGGLVSYWKFDDGSGTTATDSSGNNNNGTLINGPMWDTGKIDGALAFDGVNDYVEIGAADIIPPWTAAFWVKREDSSNSNAALLESSNYSLKIEQYPNTNKVGITEYSVADYTFNYEAPIGTWVHLVFVGSQTETVLYVDGVLTDTITHSINCPMSQISSSTKSVKGTIDDVRVYNRALNATEVLELYNTGSNITNYTLTINATNGSVTKRVNGSITTATSFPAGTVVEMTASPNTNYSFSSWSGDLTGTTNPTTVTMNANKTVTANFAINTYTITATAGSGGTISPSGTTQVNSGSSQTYTITTGTGYHIANVLVDGSSVGAVSSYTFTNVTTNHTIAASFAINTYTITATAGSGGTISPSGTTQVNSGGSQTYTITAGTGYHIANVLVDGSSVGAVSNYTFTNVIANHTIAASFAINTYTLTVSSTNGTVTKIPDQPSYDHGTVVSIEAVAASNYHFVNWTGTGVTAGRVANPNAASTTITVDSDYTIQANFVEEDGTAPYVTNLSPEANSIQVPLNNLIILHIVDNGEGVDANLVTITVDNNTVYKGNTTDYNSKYGHCRRTGTKAEYTFTYQPKGTFDSDQTVSVAVDAADLAGNAMSKYSYSFKTEMNLFSKNKRVSSGNHSKKSNPATTLDSNGDIWAVWDAGNSPHDIYVSKLAAKSDNFNENIQLTKDANDQCNAAIAVDNSDKLYVVWQDNRRGNWDIYVSTSIDGINWSAEKRVCDSNDNEINPAIVVDRSSSNKAYIVWQDDRNGNQDIYIATSSNGFVTEAISQITSNSADQLDPAVTVDSGNVVYVVWTDARNASSDIYGAASNNSWTNVPIVSKANNQSNPVIAAESSGNILHMLWVDDTLGNKDIFYASSNGLPSSPLSGMNIIDDDSGADQLAPAIITAGTKVFACWQDERNADTDLYFVEVDSGNRTNVLIGDDSTNTRQSVPAIGVDGDGYPYAVWVDNRNKNTDIYYAGSTFTEYNALASADVSASAIESTIIGTRPQLISSVNDVSIIVPPGAYPCDITITISKVKNPPEITLERFSLPYEFSPSGAEFTEPVTITIPYEVPASGKSTSAYWYNPLTAALSQEGITDVEDIIISPTLHALRFKTTHFTQFLIGGGSILSGNGGGSGGGCSISFNNQGSVIEFLLPYIGLTVVMVIIKRRDVQKRKVRSTT
jgi:hypothetical protein